MTVEEKRKKLTEYHETHTCNALEGKSDCIFDYEGAWCRNYNENNIPEDVLDDALKQIEDSLATPAPTEDIINHPSHYTNGGMECIDEMQLIFGRNATMNFCLLNAWKYRKRAMYKNGQEDMDKSDWYIAKYKELKNNDHFD